MSSAAVDLQSTMVDKSQLISQVRRFCHDQGIRTNVGIVALTVQKNRTTQFFSIIINFNTNTILDLYPDDNACSTYKEGSIGSYLYCYNDALKSRDDEDQLVMSLQAMGFSSSPNSDVNSKVTLTSTSVAQPFCCSSITPYKPRRLDREGLFTDFLSGNGSHADVVYEVTKQINNGPQVSIKYYKLEANQITELDNAEKVTQKIHAFKNYKCERHNFFYGVDLYKPSSSGVGTNFHHMRLNPKSKINMPFMQEFFTEVLKHQSTSS